MTSRSHGFFDRDPDSNEYNPSSDGNDKKKKKHKHKKKKKHRREKKEKHSAKISIEEENKNVQLTSGTVAKSNEVSDQDIMVLTTATDLDLISKIPADRFMIEENLNDDDDDDTHKIPDTGANDYLSLKRVDSSGRLIKGRGSVKYTEKSRSRSHTPPHRHSTIKDCSPRHEKRNKRHQTESTSYKYQSRSATTIKHKQNVPSNISRKCLSSSSLSTASLPPTKNDQNQEKDSQSYRRRHSSSPIDDEFEIGHSKPSQKEYVATKGANSLSSSKKKRKYWEKQDESIQQQSLASTIQYSRLDNELLMISQSSGTQLKSTSDHTNFLQQSSRQTAVYKSQPNDEYDVSSKEKAESSSRSYSYTSTSEHRYSPQKKKTNNIEVGQIFKLRKSIERIFECRLKPSSSFSSLSSSLSSSSSTTKNPRSKPRPCLIWSKKPEIQTFLITKFDGIDIDDARFDCGSLSKDYVRKRLVPITPKKGFDGKRAITARTRIKNPREHIKNSYLLLIPVEVKEEDIKKGKLLDEFFDENDLLYINDLLLSITNQENDQQAKAKQEEIKKLGYHCIPNDDDDNNDESENESEDESESSIPRRRSSANSVIDSTEKVQIWMKNYIVHNSFDDDDDQKITLTEGLIDRTEDYSLLLSSGNGLNQHKSRKSNKPVEVLFAVGGWCSGDAIASVEMFDPSSNEWEVVASMAKRRCGVGVGVLNNVLYAIGGHDGVSYLNSVERFDPQTNQWNNEIAPTSSCRASVGVAVLNGCLFVVGGQNGISCLDLVEKYDPSAQQWIRVASMGTKRLGVAAAVFDGYLYAIGGSDGQYPLSTVERYDPKANKWSSVSSMNTQRKQLGCAVYNGYIYVVGGRDDATELSTAERFNPKINQWSPLVAMNSKRSGVGLAVINNHLMAIGGFDGAVCLNSVELYDSESNSWRLHSGMNYRRLGSGVGVIKVQQYDSILYKSNSTSNILSTSSDKSEKSSIFNIS